MAVAAGRHGRRMPRAFAPSGFDVACASAAAVALCFIALPLVALATRSDPLTLVAQLGTPAALEALRVSAVTSGLALALIVAFGTPVAYLLATRRGRAADLAGALFELPLVLPPAVAGIAMLAAFGRTGLLGSQLSAAGVELPFSQAAVVLALAFVASPLYVFQARAGFAAIDRELVATARVLGGGRLRNFVSIELPLARDAMVSGAVLAWARALGEFGATIVFAGSLAGVTRTLTLTIYGTMDGDIGVSLALAVLLMAVSTGVLIAVRLVGGSHATRRGVEPRVAGSAR